MNPFKNLDTRERRTSQGYTKTNRMERMGWSGCSGYVPGGVGWAYLCFLVGGGGGGGLLSGNGLKSAGAGSLVASL